MKKEERINFINASEAGCCKCFQNDPDIESDTTDGMVNIILCDNCSLRIYWNIFILY